MHKNIFTIESTKVREAIFFEPRKLFIISVRICTMLGSKIYTKQMSN